MSASQGIMGRWVRRAGVVAVAMCFLSAWVCPVTAFADTSKAELVDKIEELERRLERMEERLRAYEKQEVEAPTAQRPQDVGGVRGLDERLSELERIGKGVELSGTIEVEANYTDRDNKGDSDEESSDLNLATAELGVNVGVTDDIKGRLLFLYEDDEDVVIDEAIIHYRADGVCEPGQACKVPFPWYASVGKLYIPFGYFESHFISDPLTLELGETRETALVTGLANDWLNVAAGVYNGDVEETGSDDHIENYVATARLTVPPDLIKGFNLMAGVSYVDNIADSNGLEGEDGVDGDSNTIEDYVGGFSAFASASMSDRYFLEAEYVGATDDFKDGELAFGSGKRKPVAWNLEFAFAATEDITLGVKYEGSDDLGNFLPEEQYGAVISYGLAENVGVSLEYLYGEFENDDERNQLTSQLAIEW